MKTISVPLELINLNNNGFHLLVEVVVFGEKHFAVLDTGASRTVFDLSFIKKHNAEILITTEDINATTLFSTASTSQSEIPTIKIGRLKITNYQTVTIDLDTVSKTYEQFGHPPIIAIIGGDILMDYQAVINYKKRKMLLHY